jgi:hypothetical protein
VVWCGVVWCGCGGVVVVWVWVCWCGVVVWVWVWVCWCGVVVWCGCGGVVWWWCGGVVHVDDLYESYVKAAKLEREWLVTQATAKKTATITRSKNCLHHPTPTDQQSI